MLTASFGCNRQHFFSVGHLYFHFIISCHLTCNLKLTKCNQCRKHSTPCLFSSHQSFFLKQDHTYQDHFCSMCPRSFELYSSITTSHDEEAWACFLSRKQGFNYSWSHLMTVLSAFCRVMEVGLAEWFLFLCFSSDLSKLKQLSLRIGKIKLHWTGSELRFRNILFFLPVFRPFSQLSLIKFAYCVNKNHGIFWQQF